jgi:CheY-like chemotaxis protein
MEHQARTTEDKLVDIGPYEQESSADRISIGLHVLVDQAIDSVRPRAAEHGVMIEARHDVKQSLVRVDEERLRRALAHVLLNGIRFSRPDRPLIVWTCFTPQFVEIGVRNAGGHRPAGRRMPSRHSASRSQVEAIESMGLDMALARHFVELQGGHLDLRAAARHGAPASTVLRLPAEIALACPSLRRAHAVSGGMTHPRLDGTHVLLVEDDPDALEFLTLILRAAGARVSGFTYAGAAYSFFVDASEADHPDVVVSDIAMPMEDGYSFLRRMRSWESSSSSLPVPAIAVTAFSREEDCRRALISGFDRHVAKPLDARKLVETIAQWA